MKKQLHKISLLIAGACFTACGVQQKNDASGTFEAVETIISSEASGKLLSFPIEEGQEIKENQLVAIIDSSQAYLNKLQLLQQQKTILSAKPSVQVQLEASRKELQTAEQDRDRIKNLMGGEVASQKQLDDANARVDVLRSRIEAQENVLNTTSSNLNEQAAAVNVQMELADLALSRCRINNPVKGTVLVKYAEANELCVPGKPLYKIASLDQLVLRCYLNAEQLQQAKLGNEVTVFVDDKEGTSRQYSGKISWISDKGEFTPKTIQTRDERSNTVYAVKVIVKNDGLLRIGMYGEIQF